MKKVFAVLIMVFISLTCVGCSSTTNLSSINTAFSSLYFAVDLSELEVEKLEESEQFIIKNKVETLAGNYINSIKLRYFEQLNNLEKAGKISSNQNIIYKNHLTPYVLWKEDVYLIEFRFYSTTSSRLFATGAEYSGAINEKKTFSTVTTEKFKYLFSKINNNQVVAMEKYFSTGIEDAFAGIGKNPFQSGKETNFYYMISTENSRLHAKNADEVLKLNSGSIFCYYSLDDKEIEFEFYVVQANVLAYYLLALAITFVFVAIYLIVIFFRKNKKVRKIDLESQDFGDENFDNKES